MFPRLFYLQNRLQLLVCGLFSRLRFFRLRSNLQQVSTFNAPATHRSPLGDSSHVIWICDLFDISWSRGSGFTCLQNRYRYTYDIWNGDKIYTLLVHFKIELFFQKYSPLCYFIRGNTHSVKYGYTKQFFNWKLIFVPMLHYSTKISILIYRSCNLRLWNKHNGSTNSRKWLSRITIFGSARE